MSETADLLVIGGNWSNSRNGVISTLFCALVDDREENIAADPQCVAPLACSQAKQVARRRANYITDTYSSRVLEQATRRRISSLLMSYSLKQTRASTLLHLYTLVSK